MATGVATIKLVKFQDPAMKTAIWYWVLINDPNTRVGPPYFATRDEAITWANDNGYKYK
jgi:hypothetical protein